MISSGFFRVPQGPRWQSLFVLCASAFLAGPLSAAAPAEEIRELLNTGEYLRAIGLSDRATREDPDDQDLHVLRIRALMAVGRYAEAEAAGANAVKLAAQSIRVRWAARDAAVSVGKLDVARRYVSEIRNMVTIRPGAYREPADLMIFARMALEVGADAKQVLDQVIATAQRADPKLRDIYNVKGELALSKHDYALAGRAYQDGIKLYPEEADFHYGLARAFENGDRTKVLEGLQAALKINPKHVPAMLMVANHRIDAEEYDTASKLIREIREIDPARPETFAFDAVIAHIRNDPAAEKAARDAALKNWPTNPLVDWLIGKKLAEKYRFAEAAAYQRQALQLDPEYLRAKMELATDLLRLGEEKEGWELVEQVNRKDGYDVEAFNLMNLKDTMSKYVTLTNDDFVLRMTAHEAEIYGQRALALLTAEKKLLAEKYGIEIAKPTYIEVFGDQKDFAVRTFGMPDVSGFLGVCFGRVVTANGAAANVASPANWEAVLWHEFAHVVTLQMTKNKMPRWLSEGISVFEEEQHDSSWGMTMTPRYRDYILKGEMSPVSELSAAFLAPPSAERLQFAYFQSALVVEFLVGKYGMDSLKKILTDLGRGVEINRALAASTAPMDTLDKEFVAFAKAKAEALAPKLEWERPEGDQPMTIRLNPFGGGAGAGGGRGGPPPLSAVELLQWARDKPNNYFALVILAKNALTEKKWAEAKTVLARIVENYPDQTGPDNAFRMLATANRGLEDVAGERAALVKLADTSDDAIDAYARLMELALEAKDWETVARYADRYLAVNPLVIAPHRFLARAAAERGDAKTAITANRAMLKLDPPDPTAVHFELAKLLRTAGDPEARRHVVMALEYAPRYREALNLLREIADSAPQPPASGGL